MPYFVKLLPKNAHLLLCKLRFLDNNLSRLAFFAKVLNHYSGGSIQKRLAANSITSSYLDLIA